MTLGERILLKRKEKGMSQEDLGNKLDVSRQTVHKWESDQAIPELNKLIAMAAVFDVKVGWLIAEENDELKDDAYKDVTERLVKLMDDGKRKNTHPANSPLSIFVGSLLIFACVFSFTKLISLEKRYYELDREIDRNNVYVQQQINGISSNVSEMLNSYNSITVNTSVHIANIDFKSNTISFEIQATPRTYTNGMKAIFHVTMGKDVYDFDGVEGSNKTFSTIADVPLIDDGANVSVEFVTGETSETSNIMTFYELLTGTFPFYEISWPFGDWIKDDYSGFEYEYFEVVEQNIYNYYQDYYGLAYTRPKIVAMEAFLTEDGVRIADYEYDEEYTIKQNGNEARHQPEVPANPADGELYVYWHEFKRPSNIKLTKGKKYLEHFIATDEYGRQIEVIADDFGREVEFHINQSN